MDNRLGVAVASGGAHLKSFDASRDGRLQLGVDVHVAFVTAKQKRSETQAGAPHGGNVPHQLDGHVQDHLPVIHLMRVRFDSNDAERLR